MFKLLPSLFAAALTVLALRAEPTAPLALTAGKVTPRPFAQTASDLKADPAVRFGVLPNGVRYALRANHEPKGRASLRLMVEAGSLHETEAQRGLAHFLEHMAFNGSTHYAPGTLVEFFQRMGMNFGGDTNANTGFNRTVYLLELPDTKPATIAEGLRVFGDFAGGLLLTPEEIDKERGIILSEKRTGDTVEYRLSIAGFEHTLGETLLPKRIPIGVEPVINQAMRPDFADFYNTWYRPERMVIVAVGDFAPATVEPQLAALATLTARGPARPAPDLGKIPTFDGVNAFYVHESEAPSTTVSISSLTPYSHETDNAANRIKYLPRDLAVSMLNRRLSILAKKEGAPFTAASVNIGESFDFLREAGIDVNCRPEQWQAALAVGEQELRRALEHGFTADELKEAAANFANRLEQAAKTAATRHSDSLADELVQVILDDNVVTTPADDLALYQPALARVTPESCLASLRAAFAPPGRHVAVMGNAQIDGDAPAAIRAAYAAAHAAPVAPPEQTAAAKFAYTDFGPAGEIVSRRRVEDLDLTLIEFKNGVRLNLKRTDFEANRIRLSVRVGTGSLTEPSDQRGLSALAGSVFTAGGLGQHSADDLRRILAGKNVGVRFRIGSDHFSFGGGTTREDLLLQLQLVTAQITDPGYRPESLRQSRKGIEQLYLSFDHTPSGPLSTEVPNLLASGDPRFGLPPKDVLLARSLAEVKTWLTPQLAHGAIEVALVGDLDIEATIAAVAKTLGALPPREAKPALTELRQVKFPAVPANKEFTIASEIPKAAVSLYWPTDDASDIHRTRRLNLLADVFGDRLRVKIREELGGTYSPECGSAPSDTYTGYGYLTASIVVDPAKAKELGDAIVAIAADLYKNGVTADELERAKKPVLTSTKESLRDNGYWLGNVLSRAQEKPEVLDWARSRLADLESITTADVSALAKAYLAPQRVYRVSVAPAPATAPAAAKP